ncbi:hypothetical protein EDC94DRAFT_594294 [Helicostylum pulchrum]|nr:hypothetical protein EDC94DRAFT_594294 [Helicostylum pulchrum]
MLQEYPTQIQPRSSSTRKSQDAFELQDSSNKVDAEASRILIDLANQDTSSLQQLMDSSNNLIMIDNKFKRRVSSKGDIKVSLPIKTDANLHLQQERSQPDPIMLLAAAAAVINDEGKYKGRAYERREIRLHGRHASAKRKSFTYGSNDDSDGKSSSTVLHRRHSERRHRYARPSVSMQMDSNDTWPSTTVNNNMVGTEDEVKGSESQSEGTHAFSWQYLSMKQNPRIKRNAMHAYITYMIYTDMAQEQHQQQRVKQQQQQQQQQQQHQQQEKRYAIKEEKQETYASNSNNNGMHSNNDWYSKQQSMQSYRLPPSPRQRHDPPTTTESIIDRPLTDFLFQRNTLPASNTIPTSTNNRLTNNFFE